MVRITYFQFVGLDEEGVNDYRVDTILCDEEEAEYYLNCIDDNLILSID